MKAVRVLVVDDEPHLSGALCRALSLGLGGGCMAESAASGEAALARLAEMPFDLLVTDLCLPGIDGLELVQRARALRPGSDLRTVLITAYGTAQIEALSRETVDAYLPKPFSLSAFVQLSKQVLDQEPGGNALS